MDILERRGLHDIPIWLAGLGMVSSVQGVLSGTAALAPQEEEEKEEVQTELAQSSEAISPAQITVPFGAAVVKGMGRGRLD